MITRSFPTVACAAALLAASSITLTTPDLFQSDPSVASVSDSVRLSTLPYELTAFSDITLQGISNAYWFGWGNYIQPDDPYYGPLNYGYPPYPQLNLPIYVSGIPGTLYYLIDNILDQFDDSIDLDNYFFEIGSQNFGIPNAQFSGLGALLYVGSGKLFGTDSPIFQAADSLFHSGVTAQIQYGLTALATAFVPKFNIGSLQVGGGTLLDIYFYGQTPLTENPTFIANTTGLPALWAYISSAITGSLAPESTQPAAVATTQPAAQTPSIDIASPGVDEIHEIANSTQVDGQKSDSPSESLAPSVAQRPLDETTEQTSVAAQGASTAEVNASADLSADTATESVASRPTNTERRTGVASSARQSVSASKSKEESAVSETTNGSSSAPNSDNSAPVKSSHKLQPKSDRRGAS
jgi:hypothetical protein